MRDESSSTHSSSASAAAASGAEPGSAANPTKAHAVQVFAIYDVDHDGDLFEQLDAQSHRPGCRFDVAWSSENARDSETWRERVRQHLREADQVIVICGEHTDASPRLHTEFQMVIDEDKPYFLLWGRRELMCTKPLGAKPADGMYSWTAQFLDDQIDQNLRKASTDAKARSLRRVTATR